MEFLGFFLGFFHIILVVKRAGFLWQVSLVLGGKIATCDSSLRRLLEGLVGKEFPAPAVYVGECRQRG
jgi:hypothetical protein